MTRPISEAWIKIKFWKESTDFREDYQFFTDILRRFGVAISLDGEFVDIESKLQLKPNHIRCILRAEYRSAGRFLTGKALDLVVRKYLSALCRAARELHAEDTHPELFHLVDYSPKDFL